MTLRGWSMEASLNCPTPMSRVRNDIPALGAATMLINPCTAYRSVASVATIMLRLMRTTLSSGLFPVFMCNEQEDGR